MIMRIHSTCFLRVSHTLGGESKASQDCLFDAEVQEQEQKWTSQAVGE
jgi:hypothetical protein